MTIDGLGRAAGSAARHKAAQEVEPAMMLRELRRAHRTRNALAAGTGLVAAAVAGVLLVRVVAPTPSLPPGGRPTPTLSASCPEGVTCLGAGHYRLNLPVPVTVTVPQNFQGSLAHVGKYAFEDYRTDTSLATGVTIMENAEPVTNDTMWTTDRSGGTTAASMAEWFLHRAFLERATKQQITVDGRSGWLLSAGLRPAVRLNADKNGEAAGPLFRSSTDATAGITRTLQGEYVLLDTPGAGVTVIWFWTYEPEKDVLLDSTSYLDHVAFG